MPSTLARLVARRATAAATTFVLLVLAAVVLVLGATDATTPPTPTSGLDQGADSTRVAALARTLPGGPVSPALAVFSRADLDQLTGDDVAQLRDLGAAVAAAVPAADLAGAAGGLEVRGQVGVLAVPLRSGLPDDVVSRDVAALRGALRGAVSPPLRVQVTGEPAVTTDLTAVFEGANGNLLLTTVAVVAVLLLVTYRSPVLWLVPLLAVGLADRVAVALAGALARAVDVPVDAAASGILSVLVFGAGTDYALLLIARYRDELRDDSDRYAAMARALRRTAPAVLASSGTVVLALLTLTLARLTSLRGLGLVCAVGVATAAVAGLVLLPAVLVLCGRWVFWPRVPRSGDPVRPGRVWDRAGGLISRHPGRVAAAGVVVLLALAAGLAGARVGLSADQQFLRTPEAVAGARTLALGLPAGTTSPLQVLARPDVVDDVTRIARSVPGVATAEPGSADGQLAEIDVVLQDAPGTPGSDRTLVGLRRALAPTGALVGGPTAVSFDTAQANTRDTRLVVPLVLLVVAAVLLLLLRSVVAVGVLVATVVLSFAAALGAAWLALTATYGTPALDVSVPLLSFLFLVALGVDYNIFLVERAREEVAAGAPTRGAILTALRTTGPVITSAGVLLAAVFAVLGVLPLLVLTQIGVIVGLGVLLDTLLVRTLVVPALVTLLGERFWTPQRWRPDKPGPSPLRSLRAEPHELSGM